MDVTSTDTAGADVAPTVAASAQAEGLDILRVYLHLLGMPADAEQLAHRLSGADSGSGPVQVMAALQSMGCEVRLASGNLKTLGQQAMPLLLQDVDGRWMLVGKLGEGGALVQCAGERSPQQWSIEQFETRWSRRWLEVKRPAPQASSDGSAATEATRQRFGLRWFWQAMRKHKALMAEVLLASFFVQVFALATPLVFQVVIDKVLTHRSLSTLDVLVVALVAVALFEVVLGAMRHYLFSHTTNRIDVELGARLFRHLVHLPLSYFESRRTGDTVARVRELENARSFLTGPALTGWLDLLFAVVFLAVMFYYSATLTFIVLATLPLFFAASWIVTPLLRHKLEDKFALGAENQAFLVETVGSMETIKAQSVEPHWVREWERRLAAYVQSAFESGHMAQASNQFVSLVSKLLTAVLLWFGARLVIQGELSVGGLIAFNMLSGRVNAPIMKLASMWQEFTQMKVSARRLADILDAPTEPIFGPDRATPPALQGGVTFERVGFRYAPQAPEVLSGLSFKVAPGEIIGVVGISGAGKSTLMRLLQRLHAPEKGRILLDGMDVNLMDTAWLRRQIGVVGQDTLLFNRSVRENIALAHPTQSMDQVMDCARLAGAHDFIMQLPQGYDTVIGERGSRLSGGQRARIAIARALAVNPRLLLLDEATASLDYESERVIHDHMAEICKGRTVFIVAHRLPTLRLADRIMVLDEGRLVAFASHKELIAQEGRYASLYRAHRVLEAA